jgi:hypothetical protein
LAARADARAQPLARALLPPVRQVLPSAELQWLEGCGHCGHLEKPQETADAILRFLRAEGARGLTSSEEEGAPVPAAAAGRGKEAA